MATHSGNDGKVLIGANTLAAVTGFSLTRRSVTMDDSAIGDAADTHLIGSYSWEAEITCHWDETDTNGQVTMLQGASIDLNLHPEGDDAGDTYWEGTATVTEVVNQVARNSVVSATFRCQGNGALTVSTV